MAKQVKLEPYTEIGDELNFQSAFIQATKALDLAGAIASNREDVEQLTTVAALYVQIGSQLMQPVGMIHEGHDEDEDEDESEEPRQAIGFAPAPVDEIIPQEEPDE